MERLEGAGGGLLSGERVAVTFASVCAYMEFLYMCPPGSIMYVI